MTLTRTSTDRKIAMEAKRAAARDVMAQMEVSHPVLGEWCPQCRNATGEQVVVFSQAMDALLAQARELAEQIVFGTMPIEWRSGEARVGWLCALRDERDAAEMILIPATRPGAMRDADCTLAIIDRRRARLADWRERLEAALAAIDKHNPVMGYIVRLAVDDVVKAATMRA